MSAGVQHLFYIIFPCNAWITLAKSSMLKPAPFFLTGILVCNQIIIIILKIEITIFFELQILFESEEVMTKC